MEFSLRATDPAFLQLVRRYMGQFQRKQADDGPLFSADCGTALVMPGGKIVRPKVHLYFGTLRIFYGRSMEEMAARLISFVRDVATRDVNEFVRIRAGAVRYGDRAVLMPSAPQSHLATLVGLLVRSGAAYLGDEVAYIDPILRSVQGTGLPLHIDADDLAAHFPELLREPIPRRSSDPLSEFLQAATPRRPVSPEELGGSSSLPVQVGWIVFPSFDEGAETRLEPMGGSEAVFRFTQAVLNLNAWEERVLTFAKDLLEFVPVSRLVIDSMAQAQGLLNRTAPEMVEGVSG